MSSEDIRIYFHARPDKSLSIERRHEQVVAKMTELAGPLGFSGVDVPGAPNCGEGLSAGYTVKLSAKGMSFSASYPFRGEEYEFLDKAYFDEKIWYGFKSSSKNVDYSEVLNKSIMDVVRAFGAYRVKVVYGLYALDYQDGVGGVETSYAQLCSDKGLDVDGRNNIYTLYPAQFWDEELCRRALGLSSAEVFSMLEGHAPKVEQTHGGIYIVLNDSRDLSYDDFVAMNNRVKPLLGLR